MTNESKQTEITNSLGWPLPPYAEAIVERSLGFAGFLKETGFEPLAEYPLFAQSKSVDDLLSYHADLAPEEGLVSFLHSSIRDLHNSAVFDAHSRVCSARKTRVPRLRTLLEFPGSETDRVEQLLGVISPTLAAHPEASGPILSFYLSPRFEEAMPDGMRVALARALLERSPQAREALGNPPAGLSSQARDLLLAAQTGRPEAISEAPVIALRQALALFPDSPGLALALLGNPSADPSERQAVLAAECHIALGQAETAEKIARDALQHSQQGEASDVLRIALHNALLARSAPSDLLSEVLQAAGHRVDFPATGWEDFQDSRPALPAPQASCAVILTSGSNHGLISAVQRWRAQSVTLRIFAVCDGQSAEFTDLARLALGGGLSVLRAPAASGMHGAQAQGMARALTLGFERLLLADETIFPLRTAVAEALLALATEPDAGAAIPLALTMRPDSSVMLGAECSYAEPCSPAAVFTAAALQDLPEAPQSPDMLLDLVRQKHAVLQMPRIMALRRAP